MRRKLLKIYTKLSEINRVFANLSHMNWRVASLTKNILGLFFFFPVTINLGIECLSVNDGRKNMKLEIHQKCRTEGLRRDCRSGFPF